MSSELERRLEAMLAEAPEPDPGAGEEALHRALRVLQPVAAPRRGIRTAVLVFAGAVVLLVIAAGSLAARRRPARQHRREAEAGSPVTASSRFRRGRTASPRSSTADSRSATRGGFASRDYGTLRLCRHTR